MPILGLLIIVAGVTAITSTIISKFTTNSFKREINYAEDDSSTYTFEYTTKITEGDKTEETTTKIKYDQKDIDEFSSHVGKLEHANNETANLVGSAAASALFFGNGPAGILGGLASSVFKTRSDSNNDTENYLPIDEKTEEYEDLNVLSKENIIADPSIYKKPDTNSDTVIVEAMTYDPKIHGEVVARAEAVPVDDEKSTGMKLDNDVVDEAPKEEGVLDQFKKLVVAKATDRLVGTAVEQAGDAIEGVMGDVIS